MAWKAEVAIPAGDQYHIIREVLPLDFGLLKYNDIGFKNVEHSL